MRIMDKKTLKRDDRRLTEATHVKSKRNEAFASLALLKKEGKRLVLYPIPSRNINDLVNEGKERKMKNLQTPPMKITEFFISRQLLNSGSYLESLLSNVGSALVYIVYFDEEMRPYYEFYINSTNITKSEPNNYKSNRSTRGIDKSCVIVDILRTNKDLEKELSL
ncbi:MAG: hypothetical protein WBL58_06040 [Peptococcia bacterium]